jgi:hypothetical protein
VQDVEELLRKIQTHRLHVELGAEVVQLVQAPPRGQVGAGAGLSVAMPCLGEDRDAPEDTQELGVEPLCFGAARAEVVDHVPGGEGVCHQDCHGARECGAVQDRCGDDGEELELRDSVPQHVLGESVGEVAPR